tara:strand:- start:24965 stop:25963 length:999 start_codon:yes stop_codon:yes gene_type:complete
MIEKETKIALLGGGSWGTALGLNLAIRHEVYLWEYNDEQVKKMQRDRENKNLLPGYTFPKNLSISSDLRATIEKSSEILIAVPSHAFRETCSKLAEEFHDIESLAWATKGLDPNSKELLSEVATSFFPAADLAVISGPTFAKEVASGMPTAITIAANNNKYANRVSDYLRSETIRPYTSEDMIGLQVGGACKNIMAIAAGISDGLGFGANARAALITRGLHEITLFGEALGGSKETLRGLSGLGDLTLTCTDNQSRNRRLGLALGGGKSIERAKEEIGQEIEGIYAAKEVHEKSLDLSIEMPITDQTFRVLFDNLDPYQAVKNLLSRETKAE